MPDSIKALEQTIADSKKILSGIKPITLTEPPTQIQPVWTPQDIMTIS